MAVCVSLSPEEKVVGWFNRLCVSLFGRPLGTAAGPYVEVAIVMMYPLKFTELKLPIEFPLIACDNGM